ncbi:MAG TPA: AI-2E family transporter [Candidatus Limnocylindria bacterium]|nr:AI-2E family transporter [Candidatus Limnocylindria bacterium]
MAGEPPLLGGIGSRERRWLLIFLILASAYVGLLLLRVVLDVLGGFSQIILVLFLAWLLAFVLSPVVRFLDELFPALPRPAVVAVTYAVTLVALGFALFYTGAAITQQVTSLTDEFPQTSVKIQQTLASWQQSLQLGRFEIDLVQLYQSAQAQASNLGDAIFSQAQSIAGATIATLGSLVLILVLSLYMLMDSDRILAKIGRLVPRRYTDELGMFERSVASAFGGFLRAQLILALVQALIVAIVGTAFGMPYLFLIGTLSALAMLIPFFGPPLALIPPIVAAWIYTDWFLVITIILVAVQSVVINWLQPRLMRDALGMHPILVLVGLLVGAQVAGVWGALFGIPVIAVINVFVNYLLESAVPNASLPERERLEDVGDHTMVRVEKQQFGDETHPSIHVHRSLRPDGEEEVTLEIDDRHDPRDQPRHGDANA